MWSWGEEEKKKEIHTRGKYTNFFLFYMFFRLAAISLTSLAYLLYSLRLTWPETEITIVSRCVCRLLASNLEFMGLSLLHILHRSWKDRKLPLCFPCLVVSKGDHCRRPYVDVSTDGIGNERKKARKNSDTRGNHYVNSFDFDDIHLFFIFATSRRKEPSFVHSWPNKSEKARLECERQRKNVDSTFFCYTSLELRHRMYMCNSQVE